MKLLKVVFVLITMMLLIEGCEKKANQTKGCPMFSIVPQQPYDDPVWHPSGKIIGFNHTPIKEIDYSYGYQCPMQASYFYEEESAGFYLINADGTNQRRILPYYLLNPAWSHDGKWIAFSKGGQIYKMPFDGENFDTAAMEQLTFTGSNFFPDWSPDDEWIAYDSDVGSKNGAYYTWKMRNNSTSKTRIASGRMPGWENQDTIIYIGLEYQVYSIALTDSVVTQITDMNSVKMYPKYSPNNTLIAYYSFGNDPEENGIWLTGGIEGDTEQMLISEATSFSWSPDGKNIVYLHRANNYRIDEETGVLWIINVETKEKRQLTYNHYNLLTH